MTQLREFNPEFTVFCGPMFSSKTTRLLSELERYKYQGKRVAVFKPGIDDRYNKSSIVSHSGWEHNAVSVASGADILGVLKDFDAMPDVVAVDEGFMIPNLADTLVWLFQRGISIVVSTLELGANGKPFAETRDILVWATRVEKCKAVCTVCGADAAYTHKKLVNDDEIEIGGAELYEPRCFSHHVSINKKE